MDNDIVKRLEHAKRSIMNQRYYDSADVKAINDAIAEINDLKTPRPIETAPKNTEVLAYRKDAGWFIARLGHPAEYMTQRELDDGEYDEEFIWEENWMFADFDHGGVLQGNEWPTHWLPIPQGDMEALARHTTATRQPATLERRER